VRAGLEVESAFLGPFFGGVGWRENLDANFWCALQGCGMVSFELAAEAAEIQAASVTLTPSDVRTGVSASTFPEGE
jgi:hypothetical protein